MKSAFPWLCVTLIAVSAGPSGAPSEIPETPRLSPEEVRTEVDALEKKDVAWRKIAWKTCLLDGLKASREQKKPVMLWIFIDRPIDKSGKPIADTVRQENYMEARFEIPVGTQKELAAAVEQAIGKRFQLPDAFAQSLVVHAFLGQLDVNPLGTVPGSRNDSRHWEFFGQTIPSGDPEVVRFRVDAESTVEGSQQVARRARTDGRRWEHRVTLTWQGYVDMRNDRVTELAMIAHGDERLRWGNARMNLRTESDTQNLMAGHRIDLKCAVRYGLFAEPCSENEIARKQAQ